MSDLIRAAQVLMGEEERSAVDRVLAGGHLVQGPEVAAFEREFAVDLVDGRECVAVSSGTAGLHLGLLATGIGPGQEVVVPSFTFAATANAVALTGATPVFADIERDTFCLDAASVDAVVTERTVAIMPVHLYGQPADMGALGAVADRHGVLLVEDAAQAHGAALDGRRVGTFGAFAMFSLYATKNMTTGEGGMVSCRDAGFAAQLRLLRNQGMRNRYENEVVGFNSRMTDLQAAIGRVQLRRLDGWTDTRRRNAAFYDSHLEGVVLPTTRPGAVHVYHQYTVRVPDDRDGFVEALRHEHDIECGVFYPVPVHRLPSFRHVLDLPVTEESVRQVASLPVHPSMTEDELERVVVGVNTVARAGGA